jgi:hypothetical protein
MLNKTVAALSVCNRRILSSAEVTAFRQQGFLKITPFAPPNDIALVRSIIDDLYSREGREIGPQDNLLHRAPELRRTSVFRSCSAIAKQLLGKTTGYAFDQALYKEPHGRNGTPWHQDGAFHGPFTNKTIGFWIPFQDVTAESGCLHFIPLGDQATLLPHRPFYPNDYRSLMTDHVNPSQAVACPLSLGEASVHGPLTLHMALANSMDFIRRTWTLTFTPWGEWGFLTPTRLFNRGRTFAGRVWAPRRP